MCILAVISVIAMKVEIEEGAHACEFKTTVPQSHLPPGRPPRSYGNLFHIRIAQATKTDHSELSTTSTMQGQRSASLSTGYLELETAGMESQHSSVISETVYWSADLAAKETYTQISCLMVSS